MRLCCPLCKEVVEYIPRKPVTHCKKCNTNLHFQCIKCGSLYRHWDSSYKHVTFYCDKPASLECQECGLVSRRKCDLESHIRNKHLPADPRSYRSCPKCRKRYKHTRQFTRHLKTCGKNVKYSCEHCDSVFSRADALSNHVLRVHPEVGGKVFPCPRCDKKYKLQGTLERHLRIFCSAISTDGIRTS